MSYDLIVKIKTWPIDLDDAVRRQLSTVGARVDGVPGATLRDHDGGWFPVAVRFESSSEIAAPARWRTEWIETGFELIVTDHAATFHAPADETAAAWLVAAALAVAAGGSLRDPQTGAIHSDTSLGGLLRAVAAARWPSGRPRPPGWDDDRLIRFPPDAPTFVGWDEPVEVTPADAISIEALAALRVRQTGKTVAEWVESFGPQIAQDAIYAVPAGDGRLAAAAYLWRRQPENEWALQLVFGPGTEVDDGSVEPVDRRAEQEAAVRRLLAAVVERCHTTQRPFHYIDVPPCGFDEALADAGLVETDEESRELCVRFADGHGAGAAAPRGWRDATADELPFAARLAMRERSAGDHVVCRVSPEGGMTLVVVKRRQLLLPKPELRQGRLHLLEQPVDAIDAVRDCLAVLRPWDVRGVRVVPPLEVDLVAMRPADLALEENEPYRYCVWVLDV